MSASAMATIAAPEKPSQYLTAPDIGGGSGEIWQLRIKCGLVIGGLDAVVEAIAHFSPLQEWVFKPLAGDWDALDRGAVAWKNAGKAASAISENIASVPAQIGDSWQGKTQQSFAKSQAKIAAAIRPLPTACDAMGQFCTALADMARAIAELIVDLITAIAEFITEMLASLAVPVAGEVAMPVWITRLSLNLAKWLPKLTKEIETFLKFAEQIYKIVEEINDVISRIQNILAVLSSVTTAISAASSASARASTATAQLN
jgi:uncharacterized protein YukE